MNPRRLTHILLPTILLLLAPKSCYALQTHVAPEGLYVHQMAHILFMGALAYLYWHTRITQDLISKGWRYLRLFCLFFFFWNLLAVIGHGVGSALLPSDFALRGSWQAEILPPLTNLKRLYYLTKMDHFLAVPALFFLFLSLRTFYLEAKEEEES